VGVFVILQRMQARTFFEDEQDAVAAEVLAHLRAMNVSGAHVLALSGDLGAGKTSLVQAIARALGVTEALTSPTFVIQKSYETRDPLFKRLIHIDAYRIEDAQELQVLGFADVVAEPGMLIAVEWAERVAALVPKDALKVTLTHEGEGRCITYHA